MAYIKALDQSSIDIDRLSLVAYKRLVKLIESGVPPQVAIEQIYLNFFESGYSYQVAVIMAKGFTEALQAPFTPKQLLDYPIGDIKLSTKLYSNSKKMGEQVEKILKEHTAVFHNLRQAALDVFSGYNQKPDGEVLRAKKILPRYLLDAAKPFSTEIDVALAKLTAEGLKTPGLRAAYLKAIDKIELGAGKVTLDKALKVASYEKQRYFANRIVQAETTLAYNRKQALKLKESDVEWVQLRPSGSHVPDICDVYLYADRYGMGEGVYKKLEAPTGHFHNFCRCRLVARPDLAPKPDAMLDANAERSYLESLVEEERNGLLPLGARAYVEKGGSLLDYMNQRKPEQYKIRTIGEL